MRYDTLGGSTLAIRTAAAADGGEASLMVLSAASAAAASLRAVPACGSQLRIVDTVLLPALARRRT